VKTRGFVGSTQGFKFDKEQGNLDVEGEPMEDCKVINKVITTPIELEHELNLQWTQVRS
jgi:hypothetical protein